MFAFWLQKLKKNSISTMYKRIEVKNISVVFFIFNDFYFVAFKFNIWFTHIIHMNAVELQLRSAHHKS